jgi:hypothetical protein
MYMASTLSIPASKEDLLDVVCYGMSYLKRIDVYSRNLSYDLGKTV